MDKALRVENISRMDQTSIYSQLADGLRARREVIGDHAWRDRDPASHLEKLKTVSEQILSLQSQIPAPLDPTLAHYLQRCSYDKALAFLETKQPA
jgi:hypothetical protein